MKELKQLFYELKPIRLKKEENLLCVSYKGLINKTIV